MASASKAIRQKRRIRRYLSLFRRMYQKEALDRIKVTTVLLSTLQQAGGDGHQRRVLEGAPRGAWR